MGAAALSVRPNPLTVFEIETREIRKLAEDLETAGKKAVPFALRNSVNRSAFEGRKIWQAELHDEMTLRNKWTERGILVEKARSSTLGQIEATLGSIRDYQATQESGGTVRGAIPTSVSSGEGRGAQPRKRLVRGPHKLPNITLANRRKGGSKKQRNAASIAIAKRQGKKHVFLETQRGKGIFRLSGGKRSTKLDMVHDTTSKSHRLPPHPTLGPTLRKLEPKMSKIHIEELVKQLRYHKVLGY